MTTIDITPANGTGLGGAGAGAITQNGPAAWTAQPPVPALTGLSAFFRPRSVAVIGASDSPGTIGRALTENLMQHRGDRTVHFVNPSHRTLFGRDCYPSIEGVPSRVDLAVIAVPAARVLEVVGACGAAGVAAGIIITAGFDEMGAAGQELSRSIRACARNWGMRIIGPNCMGVIDANSWLNASFVMHMPRAGGLAILSQSGAVGAAMLDFSRHEQIGIGCFVSIGDMVDVTWGELIGHLADDPAVKAILIYMEAVGDARAFLSAAREASPLKPIVVLKPGRTPAGARAARLHTGADVGDDAAIDAAFAAAGILRVDSIVELFAVAEILATPQRSAGRRLAMLTNGGGLGVIAADAAVAAGLEVPELAASTLEQLGRLIPAYASHADPVDVLGDADEARYAQAAKLILEDPQVDGLLAMLAPVAVADSAAIAARLAAVAAQSGKPVLASWVGGPSMEEARLLFRAKGIPSYLYPETAVRAFARVVHHREDQERLDETPVASPGARHPTARDDGADIIGEPANADAGALTADAARRLLACYGIGGAARTTARERAVDRPSSGSKLALRLTTWTDRQLGPVIAIGWGGERAEDGERLSVALPPVSEASALRLVARTSIARALASRDARFMLHLVEAIAAISRLVSEQRAVAAMSVDLRVSARACVPSEARITLHPPGAPVPPPAIRPYPADYVSFERFGSDLLQLRPIRPDDEDKLVRFHGGLSEETVRRRYFHAMGLSARIAHPRLGHLCHADYDRELALVAELPACDGMDRILAVARLNRDHRDPTTAELAVVVADDWQGKGLGRMLVRRLVEIAPREGYRRIVTAELPDNAAMIHLLESEGFSSANDGEAGLMRTWLELEPMAGAKVG